MSSPEVSHTSNAPTTDGTCPVTSDGWTKIDAPMIVPTTMAVAWGWRMARWSPDAAVTFIGALAAT